MHDRAVRRELREGRGWKRHPKVRQLLRGLGDGSLTLDHDSFDAAPGGPRGNTIRQLLAHHDLLPYRVADLARFEASLGRLLDSIADPAVRRPQEITETGKFLAWLAGRGTAITGCSQADLDQWLADG